MRHAQEYWLRLQADAAIKDAMSLDASHIEHAVNAEIEETTVVFESNAEVAMQFLRDANILIARDALIKAELLHREIVKQGGTV